MLPRTVILGINLHGEIPLNEQGLPYTKNLEIQNLIQLNSVACGVPNVSTFETYDKLSELVADFVDEEPLHWDENINKEELKEYSTKIQDILTENNKEEKSDIERQYKKLKTSDQPDLAKSFGSYVHTSDKAYKITSFVQGDIISDKIFYKFTPEELEQYDLDEETVENAYFNKIFVYNTEDKINIFELLQAIGHELSEISLFNLIELLQGMEVENIILIDLSCAVFKNFNKEMIDERHERYLRREMEKRKLRGGKKNTRRIRKTGKRKNKNSKKRYSRRIRRR